MQGSNEEQEKRDSDLPSRSKEDQEARGRRGEFQRPFSSKPPANLEFDYKDPSSLRPFISEGGRIIPARTSHLTPKQQRRLTREIKRARELALLPASDRHRSYREV